MTDPVPLTAALAESLRVLERYGWCINTKPDGLSYEEQAAAILAHPAVVATLDRARSTPSVDGLREARVVECPHCHEDLSVDVTTSPPPVSTCSCGCWDTYSDHAAATPTPAADR